jgi:hypothetical protein
VWPSESERLCVRDRGIGRGRGHARGFCTDGHAYATHKAQSHPKSMADFGLWDVPRMNFLFFEKTKSSARSMHTGPDHHSVRLNHRRQWDTAAAQGGVHDYRRAQRPCRGERAAGHGWVGDQSRLSAEGAIERRWPRRHHLCAGRSRRGDANCGLAGGRWRSRWRAQTSEQYSRRQTQGS